MSNSSHLHILTEQTKDDGPMQRNGLLLRCFNLQCRRQNSNSRSIFTNKTQTQMVWVTNLTWNAPKMIYHVLSALSGPLCSHLHLWCLQSVFSRSASLSFFCQLPQPSGTHFFLFRFSFCCQELNQALTRAEPFCSQLFLPHLGKLHCLPFSRSKHTGRNHSSSSNPWQRPVTCYQDSEKSKQFSWGWTTKKAKRSIIGVWVYLRQRLMQQLLLQTCSFYSRAFI